MRATAAPAPVRVAATGRRLATWWPLAGALVLALALRLPFFAAPLGIDEGGYTYVARAWSGLGHPFLYGPYWVDRPPLLLGLFKLAGLGGAAGVRTLGVLAALTIVVGTYLIAREVGGPVLAGATGLVCAILVSAAVLDAVYTPGELLATAPATLALAALVRAHRRDDARWLAAGAVLAAVAVLVKQSAVDAGVAGAVLALAGAAMSRRRRAWPLIFAGGVAAALAVLGAWMAASGVGVGQLADVVVGFRLTALHALSATEGPFTTRAAKLGGPFLDSGLVVALPAAVAGIALLRRDRLLALTLAAWLAAGIAAVLLGGSYWPHYLIQLIPASALGSAVVLTRMRAAPRRAVLLAAVVLAVSSATEDAIEVDHRSPQQDAADIGTWIRHHARPGDTQLEIYARANIAWYDGLRTPYPYLWTLMLRGRTDAMPRLRALLASPARPTWLVSWQPTTEWGLDRGQVVHRLIMSRYRRVATIHGHGIYHRLA